MKINKQIIISVIMTLIGLNILGNAKDVIITPLSAIVVLITFSLASLGITEYFFGNKNKTFTYQELFMNLAIIVGILLAITYLLPQLTFGQNVFMKEALGIIQ